MSDNSTQSKLYLTVVGPESVIQSLAALKGIEGVTLGNAEPLDSLADAVDAPLGPDEVKLLLEFLTVSLGLGAATLQFIEAMVSLMKKVEPPAPTPAPVVLPPPQIIILDGRTNREIVRIDENTDAAKTVARLTEWRADEK